MSSFFHTLIRLWIIAVIVCLFNSVFAKTRQPENVNAILFYIDHSWHALERSMTQCKSLNDSKTNHRAVLYLPADFPISKDIRALKKQCRITIKKLPKKIKYLGELSKKHIQPPGLLYLPNPYIVPGGRFNEMYGWDSYFIIRGLLESGKLQLAYGIVENFFFEIDHYGGTLNGNRTYFLSRTQLPFLAPVIRAIYNADQKHHLTSLEWLKKAYHYAAKDYRLWLHPSHLAGKTGLSRYYDFGEGPVSEMNDSPRSYYIDVIHYFLLHPEVARPYLLKPQNASRQKSTSLFDIYFCPKKKIINNRKCKLLKKIGLTSRFYRGDRAMRESGFDTSFRFGPFSADTVDYAPVDLNSLLYKAEKDLEWMSETLNDLDASKKWHKIAEKRRRKINQYLWNKKKGMYFDYNFKTKRQSIHPYATTYYPLWTGLASKYQAKKLLANLKLFEKPGGIVTSLQETGVQWDYPYGWAPIQLVTIEGLYTYGYKEAAERLSTKFLKMVLRNFKIDHTIREKYNVITESHQTNIKFGYKTNVIGFGWTNAVFLVLLNALPKELIKSELDMDLSYVIKMKAHPV